MRRLVIAAAVAALVVPTGAHASSDTILSAEVSWTGGTYFDDVSTCVTLTAPESCQGAFQVRPGEQYLHLMLDRSWTTSEGLAAVTVYTAQGPVHVCGNTKSGPLDITGLDYVRFDTFLHDSVCGGSIFTLVGHMTAYFSERPVTLGEAYQTAVPDPDARDAWG